jgi:hypothetical protein
VTDLSVSAVPSWYGFAVGDLIELRDATGSVKELEEIESFGANEASTPDDASTDTVNVVGTIASAIATDDYITFQPWATATVTANMSNYCAQAGSDERIDSDSARVYL